MKDFKYKTSFSAVIKPLVSEEKDKYLAMASLLDVGEFLPEIDTDKNIDLLPIAQNIDYYAPNTLAVELNKKNNKTFKLGSLCRMNGFEITNGLKLLKFRVSIQRD